MEPADRVAQLDSWKAIAAYLKRDLRTVQRWEQTRGLPVHRLPGGGRGAVYAVVSEIDEWQQKAALVRDSVLPDLGRRRKRLALRVVLPAGLAALVFAAILALVLFRSADRTQDYRLVPLTTLPGDERWPSFAPDGKRVAFGWRREGSDHFELYVVEVGGAEPTRIAGKVDSTPAWSHDGRSIAFHRRSPDSASLFSMIVPATGGVERQVAEVAQNFAGRLPPQIAWTGDDKWVISADRDTSEGPFRLVLISVASGEKRILTNPPPGSRGDQAPAVSPDGKMLAFLRLTSVGTLDLWLLPLVEPEAAREPRRMTVDGCCAAYPMWDPSSREILYVSRHSDGSRILSLPVDAGRRSKPAIVRVLAAGSGFSLSPSGARLVFSTARYDEDIWRLDRQPGAAPFRVISSTLADEQPAVSPDARAIAFSSDRTGAYEIWTTRDDGSAPLRLTKAGKGDVLTPRWSPDGRWIAFECATDICAVPASGGAVVRVTSQSGRDVAPSWSRDGKWIYFGSSRSGEYQIWKVAVAADGRGGTPVRVTKGGGYGGVESFDGKTLYYAKSEQGGEIWSVPVGGGAERPLPVPLRYYQRPENFTAASSGLYSLASVPEEQSFQLLYWRFGTTGIERIAKLRGMPGTGVSVAPDETFLLYSAIESRPGDLMLVENFR